MARTMTQRLNRRKFIQLTGAGAGITLAGCSTQQSSGTTEADGGDGGTTTTTSSGGGGGSQDTSPIPIGSLFPLTGFWSENGRDIRDAIQFTFDQVNAAGGPLGREINHIDSDNEGADAQVAVQKMNKMISQDGIMGHVGPTSGTLPAVKNIVEENEIVAVSPTAGTHVLWRDGPPYWWRTVPDDFLGTFAITKTLRDTMNAESVAIIGSEIQSSKSISEQLAKTVPKAGIEITTEVFAPSNKSQISSTAKKALTSDPDAVLLTGQTGQVPSIMRTMLQNGYQTNDALITSEARSSSTFKQVSDPEIIEGALSIAATAPEDTDAYKYFAENYKSAMEKDSINTFAPPAYDAAMTLAIAIQAAGTTDSMAVAEQLRPISNPPGKKVYTFEAAKEALDNGEEVNYDGVTGPINFDEWGNVSGSFGVYVASTSAWEIDHLISPKDVRSFQDEILNS